MQDRRGLLSSVILVVAVFAVLLIVGAAAQSEPPANVAEGGNRPTSTTTTEPPPEGVVIVELRNGSFSPANLKLDINVNQIVRWINTDPRDVTLFDRSPDKLFNVPLPASGGQFEFDYGSLEPAIYRYSAEIGLQLIPGQIDTRPEQ